MKKRFAVCSKDCYGACVFDTFWDDTAEIQKLQICMANKDHPFTQGFFCPKYQNRAQLLYHQDRLKVPLIRSEPKGTNSFNPLSFKDAWDEFSNQLFKTLSHHGSESILYAYYSGNSCLISQNFPLRVLKTFNMSSTVGGICNEGGCAGLNQLFGTYSTTNPFEILHPQTHLIVIWGSNLSDNNIHAYLWVKKAQKQGVKLVVIDSRETQIAKEADLFLHTHPNTEFGIALSLSKQIISQNLIDKDFLESYVKGYEEFLKELNSVELSNLKVRIGIDQSQITKFYNLLLENRKHTVFNVGFGLQKDRNGGKFVQSIAILQILLGNFGSHGCGLIYSQSAYKRDFISKMQDKILGYPLLKKNDLEDSPNNEVEIIKLAEALESSKYKMLIVYGFNPASSLPNQNRLRQVLKRKDLYIVVLDLFLNETTRYADLVFPGKFEVETNDLLGSYYIPGLSLTQAGPCPYSECRSNFEFFNKLGLELSEYFATHNLKTPYSNEELKTLFPNDAKDEELVEECLELLPDSIKKTILIQGYSLFITPEILFFENMYLPTNSSKIELDKFSLMPMITNKEIPDDAFALLTPNHKNFLHSQLGQLNSKYIPDFSKIYLSPDDISALKLEIGVLINVFNDFGNNFYIVDVMSELKSHSVLIFSGGIDRNEKKSNVNQFISDQAEELGHSGIYNGCWVKLAKIIDK